MAFSNKKKGHLLVSLKHTEHMLAHGAPSTYSGSHGAGDSRTPFRVSLSKGFLWFLFSRGSRLWAAGWPPARAGAVPSAWLSAWS